MNCHKSWFLCILFVIFWETSSASRRVKRIVGGNLAAAPPPDDPVVFIRKYERNARVEGLRNPLTGLYSFLGVYYAKPPTGQNRFTRPQLLRLEGDINATKYGPPCAQPSPSSPNQVVGNENCLLLNIFTPRMPDGTSGLPVLIWIHGGGFRYGSASQYGAEPITQGNVLFVPIQYRLGSLGIIGEKKKDFSGNLAMLDMTAALRWVTEYISFFGGDPKQIKVVGHGSGATSAMLLPMSRMSRGAVTGVVSMSGSAFSQYALDEKPSESMNEIVSLHNCSSYSEKEALSCLKKKSVEDIIIADSDVQTERLHGRSMMQGLTGGVGFSPHVDSPDDRRGLPGFLTSPPDSILEHHSIDGIPLLIGLTKDETANGLNLKEVENLYGSVKNFLNATLKSYLGIGLLSATSNLTKELLNPIFGQLGLGVRSWESLLELPSSLNPEEIFMKLAETTTDVFFSLPAVLSATIWGKLAPSFLYSFEYLGSVASGKDFLGPLPIVSERNKGYVAHGDELAYLFDVNDIFGNPIQQSRLKSSKDLNVRKIFTTFISNFAHLNQSSFEAGENSLFKAFSLNKSPFVKITDKIDVAADFRFCQLSLLGLQLNSIANIQCENLAKGLAAVQGEVGKMQTNLKDTLESPKILNNQTLPLINIFSGNKKSDRGGLIF